MVAVIKVGRSIHRILNYNENKVKEGVAQCIGAGNYPLDPDQMTVTMKLNRFLKQMEMNENAKRSSVHISLNFDTSEGHLPQEKLLAIAEDYMERIGFGKQPFLVYQHHDAGHPHIHVVTTNIEANGKRIDLHHLGIRKSEPARKAIEKDYGLVAAEAQKKVEQQQLKPVSAAKVMYGKSPTKAAIQNVLEAVLNQYKYASLPELNAVLKQYNVLAERGSEHSRVYQHKGLLYRVLDANGKPTGVPIKASLFYNKPTLPFLETKFKENEVKRMPHKARVKNAIDLALVYKKATLQDLIKALEKQGIHTALRTNDTGLIYGVTYVDHQTKCVFNGSSLGKAYSAKALQERCQGSTIPQSPILSPTNQKMIGSQQTNAINQEAETSVNQNDHQGATTPSILSPLLDALMQPEDALEYLPHQLKKGRRKKKRKNRNTNQ